MAGCTKGCGGCLLKILIALAVIIVLLIIAVVIVINLTPEQLGIADLDLGGITLRELGLADVKIIEMFKLLNNVMNPDVDAIVTNKYNPTVEKPQLDGNLFAATNTGSDGGEFKYSDILDQTVIYDKEYLYLYNDTTLAYLFQEMLTETETSGAEVDNGAISFLKELNASVEELTIGAAGAGAYELRLVVSIDISEFKNEVMANVPSAVASFVKLPDRVYIVSYSSLSADSEGNVVTEGKSIRINDMQSVVADAIFKVLSQNASESVETDEDLSDSNAVNDLVGEGFVEVVGHLGRVGSAPYDSATNEITAEINFADSGIKEHGLTVVTYTAETDPDRETADTAAMYIDSDKINAAIGRIECVKVFADPVLKACERFDASTAVKFKISD